MKKYPLYYLSRWIFAPLFKFYYHPQLIGKEKILKDGPLLLVGNHKHALDPILVDLCTKRIVHALAKSELFRGPFGFFFRHIGAISVDLDAPKNPVALHKGMEMLNNGEIVNISPEAERNYTDKLLLPFKKGAAIMSLTTKTTILPYCIVGDYRFHSKNLKIVFGEYLTFDTEDVDTANAILYSKVEKLLMENKE